MCTRFHLDVFVIHLGIYTHIDTDICIYVYVHSYVFMYLYARRGAGGSKCKGG